MRQPYAPSHLTPYTREAPTPAARTQITSTVPLGATTAGSARSGGTVMVRRVPAAATWMGVEMRQPPTAAEPREGASSYTSSPGTAAFARPMPLRMGGGRRR